MGYAVVGQGWVWGAGETASAALAAARKWTAAEWEDDQLVRMRYDGTERFALVRAADAVISAVRWGGGVRVTVRGRGLTAEAHLPLANE